MKSLTQALQSNCQSSSGRVDDRANGTRGRLGCRGSRDFGPIVITIAIRTSSLDLLRSDSHWRGVRCLCRATNCRCHVVLQKLFQGCIRVYDKFLKNLTMNVKSPPIFRPPRAAKGHAANCRLEGGPREWRLDGDMTGIAAAFGIGGDAAERLIDTADSIHGQAGE